MSRMPPDPPSPNQSRLTRLLARWASARRLGELQAEAIRRAIVATPSAPDFEWWWSLLDPTGGSAFRSVPSWPAFPATPALLLELPTGTPTGFTPRHLEDADYQPYLRLT